MNLSSYNQPCPLFLKSLLETGELTGSLYLPNDRGENFRSTYEENEIEKKLQATHADGKKVLGFLCAKGIKNIELNGPQIIDVRNWSDLINSINMKIKNEENKLNPKEYNFISELSDRQLEIKPLESIFPFVLSNQDLEKFEKLLKDLNSESNTNKIYKIYSKEDSHPFQYPPSVIISNVIRLLKGQQIISKDKSKEYIHVNCAKQDANEVVKNIIFQLLRFLYKYKHIDDGEIKNKKFNEIFQKIAGIINKINIRVVLALSEIDEKSANEIWMNLAFMLNLEEKSKVIVIYSGKNSNHISDIKSEMFHLMPVVNVKNSILAGKIFLKNIKKIPKTLSEMVLLQIAILNFKLAFIKENNNKNLTERHFTIKLSKNECEILLESLRMRTLEFREFLNKIHDLDSEIFNQFVQILRHSIDELENSGELDCVNAEILKKIFNKEYVKIGLFSSDEPLSKVVGLSKEFQYTKSNLINQNQFENLIDFVKYLKIEPKNNITSYAIIPVGDPLVGKSIHSEIAMHSLDKYSRCIEYVDNENRQYDSLIPYSQLIYIPRNRNLSFTRITSFNLGKKDSKLRKFISFMDISGEIWKDKKFESDVLSRQLITIDAHYNVICYLLFIEIGQIINLHNETPERYIRNKISQILSHKNKDNVSEAGRQYIHIVFTKLDMIEAIVRNKMENELHSMFDENLKNIPNLTGISFLPDSSSPWTCHPASSINSGLTIDLPPFYQPPTFTDPGQVKSEKLKGPAAPYLNMMKELLSQK